ncbi:hypothetical protein [Falsiroseomonas sp. CW058]|uniref:hypothetical protein n=1 Tax=Falsiroseomonas sp. CW058 TaxID=3388664 RepID=UPI003D31833C
MSLSILTERNPEPPMGGRDHPQSCGFEETNMAWVTLAAPITYAALLVALVRSDSTALYGLSPRLHLARLHLVGFGYSRPVALWRRLLIAHAELLFPGSSAYRRLILSLAPHILTDRAR